MFSCPECGARTSVTKTRGTHDSRLKRRRRCKDCGYRFNTFEAVIEDEVKLIQGAGEPVGKAFILTAHLHPGGWQCFVEGFCCSGMKGAWANDTVRFGDDWEALYQEKPEVHIFDFDWEEGWPEPVRLPGEPVKFCAWCGASVTIEEG